MAKRDKKGWRAKNWNSWDDGMEERKSGGGDANTKKNHTVKLSHRQRHQFIERSPKTDHKKVNCIVNLWVDFVYYFGLRSD